MAKHWWMEAVRRAIISYPELRAKKDELQSMNTTPAVKSIVGPDGKPATVYPTGGGGGNSRKTETVALRELPPMEERALNAVRNALDATALLPDGKHRLGLIRVYWWSGHRNILDAADRVHLSERTARRWNNAFVWTVAMEMGFVWPYKAKDKKNKTKGEQHEGGQQDHGDQQGDHQGDTRAEPSR